MFQVRDVGFAVASARQQNGCHLLSYEMQNGMSDPASHWHRPASSLAGARLTSPGVRAMVHRSAAGSAENAEQR